MAFQKKPSALAVPDGAVSSRDTLVFLSLVRLHEETGRVVLRDIAAELDVSVSTVHASMQRLRDAGLVDFGTKLRGTLRPLVDVVSI